MQVCPETYDQSQIRIHEPEPTAVGFGVDGVIMTLRVERVGDKDVRCRGELG